MLRAPGRVIVGCLAICLVLGACGNSTKSASSTTSAPAGKASGKGGEAHKDEKVDISGVPGVSDDAITYSVVGTKTGNLLGTCILDCYVEGIEAYFAYRNSEGGIYGRDLKVGDVLDDELGQNQARSLDVISGGESFGNFQATLLATGWGDLDEAGIPTYTWGINSTEAANRSHIFPSLVIRCADCIHPTLPYVAMEKGGTKVGSIGYGATENSKVCTNANTASFDQYEEESGVEAVYTNDDLDYGLPNGIGPEVTAMKKAGVDVITACIDLNGMKTLASELHRQDMDDVVLIHPNTYDQAFVKEADPLFENDAIGVQFRPFETESKGTGLEQFMTWMDKQGSDPTELAMVGWINAATAYEGLLQAGPEFDQASVTAATNAITDFTADGVLEPIDWSKAHTPYTQADPDEEDRSCAAFVNVEDAKFVPWGDKDKPWLCWEADKDAPLEPTPTNFE